MRTPTLLDVPKTHPSKAEKLKAFKLANGIETHNAGPGWGKKNQPWSALHIPSARQIADDYEEECKTMFDYVSQFCRLLDEAGYLVTGETEREAIRALCELNNIPCDL